MEPGHCKAPDVSLVSAQTLLHSMVQLSCHLGISFVSKGLRLYFGNAALRFPRVRCSYLNKKNRTAVPRTHYREATGRLHSLQTPPTLHRAQAALLSCSGCQRLHFGRCSSGRAVPGPCCAGAVPLPDLSGRRWMEVEESPPALGRPPWRAAGSVRCSQPSVAGVLTSQGAAMGTRFGEFHWES